MDDSRLNDFQRELDALATIRDELKLKAHLARADLKTELAALEDRWALAEEQLRRSAAHVKQDAKLVEYRFTQLIDDLKTGFRNAKRAFDAD